MTLLAGSIEFNEANMPTRVGEKVGTVGDIVNIPTPRVGMLVFVEDEQKVYIIRSLKDAVINGVTARNAVVDRYELFDVAVTETELLKRIQGTSENSDATKDPFKFIGNFDSFEALIEKLDTMHGSIGESAKVYNGHFRAKVGSKLVDIFNEVQGYATDVWSQRITCAGLVLRNDVVRTETSYSNYSDNAGHKYRQHSYTQKFVDAVGGGVNFDKKSGVKTFCRRHYLTGNNVSTWTPWYDVENPYVQSQNYGKKIALFGGSFAQNMAVNSSDYQFTHEGTSYNLVDYIAEKLGAVAFDDYAVGGQGMRCDEDSPFPVHIMNQLRTARSKGIYDIYIIMGGVNDYWSDEVPLGDSAGYSAENENASTEQKISYCGGMRAAVDYIRVKAPNAQIYTITPFKGYNIEEFWNPKTATRNALGNSFYEFVQAQKEVAQVVSVPCLDLWVQQGFGGANAYLNYLSDLLHPNGNGYYKVSEKIVEFVAHGVGNEVVDVQALSTPLDDKITAEIQRAKQAEEELHERIDNITTGGGGSGGGDVTTEQLNAVKADVLANTQAIDAETQRAKGAEDRLTKDVEYLRDSTVVYGEKPEVVKSAVMSDGMYSPTSYSARVNKFNGGTTILLNDGYYFKEVLRRNADNSVKEFITFSDKPKYYRAEDANSIYELNISKENSGAFSTDELANIIAEVTLFGSSSGGGDITATPTEEVIDDIEPTLVSTALRKTPQVLTDAEKEIARNNIDAVGYSDLNNAIATAITNTLNTEV